MTADGFSLDDKRTPLLDAAKLGPVPEEALTAEEQAKNNLPDILARWDDLVAEADRTRTAQSFMVKAEEIAATDSWDLSLTLNRAIGGMHALRHQLLTQLNSADALFTSLQHRAFRGEL